MLTRILKNTPADISSAGEILKNGGLCAIPTETVYGLAADGLNPQAVTKIFKAKGRPQDNPLILHIRDMNTLETLCHVNENALLLAAHFWPGPLTLVLPKKDIVPSIVTAGLESVAIRMPSSSTAAEIIKASGTPLAAPSANTSGRPSPTTAGHVALDLGGKIDSILDGGPCSVGLESTVISLVDKPRLLRPGFITLEQLRAVLDEVQMDNAVLSKLPEGVKAASPGMKYKHYAPKAKMYLVQGSFDAVTKYIRLQTDRQENTGVLCFSGEEETFPNALCISYGNTDDQHAQKLFFALRAFDETDVAVIYARMPDRSGIGLAVLNRMIRAAAHRIISLK